MTSCPCEGPGLPENRGTPRRANARAVRISNELCGLTGQYRCHRVSILSQASASDKSQFRLKHSALSVPLDDSRQPFSHELPRAMYKVATSDCVSLVLGLGTVVLGEVQVGEGAEVLLGGLVVGSGGIGFVGEGAEPDAFAVVADAGLVLAASAVVLDAFER